MNSSNQNDTNNNARTNDMPLHHHEQSSPTPLLKDTTNEPMQNYDGTEMRDHKSQLVYKSQFLSTHPLWSDCKERVGYGGKKFTYVSGDGVIRSMNAIFGHGGWSSQILNEKLIQSEKDDRGRWYVGYLATVRVTLLNGVSHEDCGSGEGINDSKIKAHEKAIKSAVTDAMKRAARHFGERLGNALYVKGNGIRTAPRTNKDALAELERKDALNLFGNQASLRSVEEDKVAAAVKSSPSNTNNDAVRMAAAATLTASTGASRTGSHSFAQQNLGGNNSNSRSSVQSTTNRPMPPPAPSPIVSRGPLQQQQQQRPQPYAQGNINSNQANTYVRQQQQQHQPTSQMAPPPRPMYNPLNSNNTAASTVYQSSNNIQQQSVTMKRFSSSGSSSTTSSGGSDDNAKRQKLNPYSNNSRLSV